MPLKIFTDEALLSNGVPHVPMLVPFMGRVDPPESPEAARFDSYAAIGRDLFQMSTLGDADVAVLPFGWESVLANRSLEEAARRFADQVERAGKRLLVFCESDSAEPVPFVNAIVYRTSLYGATRGANEFAMPAFSGDLAKYRHSPPAPLVRNGKPIAGFLGQVASRRGFATTNLRIALTHAIGRNTGEPRSFHTRAMYARARERAVSVLETSSTIDARVVRLAGFAGGSMRADGSFDWAMLDAARERFVKHADSCEYLLCVRGGGNFSYRFYEAMCLGRIPIFVDTDCVLPFADRLDWRSKFPRVDVSRVDSVPTVLRHFDDALSPDTRRALHQEMRGLWEHYLSPEGFFTTLARTLS